jgi:hypothetical protein
LSYVRLGIVYENPVAVSVTPATVYRPVYRKVPTDSGTATELPMRLEVAGSDFLLVDKIT